MSLNGLNGAKRRSKQLIVNSQQLIVSNVSEIIKR